MSTSFIGDHQRLLWAALDAFNEQFKSGQAVKLMPAEGMMESMVLTELAGEAYIEGNSVVVMVKAARMPVHISRIQPIAA